MVRTNGSERIPRQENPFIIFRNQALAKIRVAVGEGTYSWLTLDDVKADAIYETDFDIRGRIPAQPRISGMISKMWWAMQENGQTEAYAAVANKKKEIHKAAHPNYKYNPQRKRRGTTTKPSKSRRNALVASMSPGYELTHRSQPAAHGIALQPIHMPRTSSSSISPSISGAAVDPFRSLQPNFISLATNQMIPAVGSTDFRTTESNPPRYLQEPIRSQSRYRYRLPRQTYTFSSNSQVGMGGPPASFGNGQGPIAPTSNFMYPAMKNQATGTQTHDHSPIENFSVVASNHTYPSRCYCTSPTCGGHTDVQAFMSTWSPTVPTMGAGDDSSYGWVREWTGQSSGPTNFQGAQNGHDSRLNSATPLSVYTPQEFDGIW